MSNSLRKLDLQTSTILHINYLKNQLDKTLYRSSYNLIKYNYPTIAFVLFDAEIKQFKIKNKNKNKNLDDEKNFIKCKPKVDKFIKNLIDPLINEYSIILDKLDNIIENEYHELDSNLKIDIRNNLNDSLKKFKLLLNKLNKRYNSLFDNDELEEINKRILTGNQILSINNIKSIRIKALKNNLLLNRTSTYRTLSMKSNSTRRNSMPYRRKSRKSILIKKFNTI
tara:strand:- start:5893 stop:6567 length:675 start_codon:yes stop_codon:yes gene_type:complete